MIILGIESTCDETACALVRDGTTVLAQTIASQIITHQKTQGVVPEVAARAHARAIIPVLDRTLKDAHEKHGLTRDNIDAIAVSYGPGLLGCLLTGITTAQTLAFTWGKPLIPVNHIEGHLYSGWLREDGVTSNQIPEDFPILVLTASGGHNQLVLMKSHGDYQLLGTTLDDAAGEAFDKGARMMGLPYPGGPSIQECALHGNDANDHKAGDPLAYAFPISMMKNDRAHDYNFSFSGLKTSLRTQILKLKKLGIFESEIPNICASYEHTICLTLIHKIKKAVHEFHPKSLHIAGGVSANLHLRALLNDSNFPCEIIFPPLAYCTDNAAMIASAGFFNFSRNPHKYSNTSITPDPTLRLGAVNK